MKKLFLSFALFFALILSANAEPVKRVLFEQHTGAWCGWCVDGTYKLEQILEEFPGRVIPVKLHNGDAMVPPVQGEIASGLGLTGYPAGCIDRKKFNGKAFPERTSSSDYSVNAWAPLVESQLDAPAKIDIRLLYSLDPSTRELKATVSALMMETISSDLTFNVYVIEDSCTGSGTGWDQHNYLTGRAGWEFNPYYNLPDLLENYYHRFVVRDLLGGAWGITGEFTNPAETGTEYSHEFNTTLNPDWNLDRIQVVAFVSDKNTKEVLNCCYVSTSPPAFEITTVSPELGAADNGEKFTRTFDVKNISEIEHNLAISFTKGAKTPDDWTVELDKTALTVAPGTTGSFSVSITPGATVGFGDAKITVKSTTDNEVPGVYGNIGAVSKSIEYFEIISKAETANSVLPLSTQQDNYIQVESKDFLKFYDVLPNLNTVIWNIGEADAMPIDAGLALGSLVAKGVDVFMIGFNILPSLHTAGALSQLGIEYTGSCADGYVSNPPYMSFIQGVANEMLTYSLAKKTIFFNRTCQFMHVGKITNPAIASPVLVFKNTQKVNLIGGGNEDVDYPNAVLAFRITLGESKIVILGMNPNGVSDDVPEYKELLINRPLEWFKGILDVENEGNVNSQISIIPNPVETSANITLNISGSNASLVRLSLFDALGQEVSVIHNGTLSPGQYSFSLESANLANGSYHIVFSNGVNVSSTPVMILK